MVNVGAGAAPLVHHSSERLQTPKSAVAISGGMPYAKRMPLSALQERLANREDRRMAAARRALSLGRRIGRSGAPSITADPRSPLEVLFSVDSRRIVNPSRH